jgi:hypothetical protein
MGVIIEFLAVAVGADTTGDGREVASISINSRATGSVFEVLATSPLAELVGDSNVAERTVIVRMSDFTALALFALSLRDMEPDEALRDLANVLDDAINEASWGKRDLRIVAT